jgi:hypothetical protein
MPSNAKIRINRKSRNSSETIERMLLSSDMTRLRKEAQYLKHTKMNTSSINLKKDEGNINCPVANY